MKTRIIGPCFAVGFGAAAMLADNALYSVSAPWSPIEQPELGSVMITTTTSLTASFNLLVTYAGALEPEQPIQGERPGADLYGPSGLLVRRAV
jgi:hypothetical protein